MQITNKNMYRIIADDNSDYIAALSMNWWGCLYGLLIWIFPMRGYVLNNREVSYSSISKRKKFVLILIPFVCFIFLIILSSILKVVAINISINFKIIVCAVSYTLSIFVYIGRGHWEQKRYRKINPEEKVVYIRIHFKSIWNVLQIVLIDILIRFIFCGFVIVCFITLHGTEAMMPFVFVTIWFFTFCGEAIKTLFSREDISRIEVLEEKLC